jgi:hypothetical protein
MNTLRRIGLWFGSFTPFRHSVQSALQRGPDLRARVGPSHFSRHYDICASGLVPVPALRDCTKGCRTEANLDHPLQWDSNRARIAGPLVSHPSAKKRRPYDLAGRPLDRPRLYHLIYAPIPRKISQPV